MRIFSQSEHMYFPRVISRHGGEESKGERWRRHSQVMMSCQNWSLGSLHPILTLRMRNYGRVPHNSPTAQIVSQKMSVSHNVLGQFDELLQQLLVTEGDDTLQGGGAASEMSEV